MGKTRKYQKTKTLYALELNVSLEAKLKGLRVPRDGYWVIHEEWCSDGYSHLFVFRKKKDALAETKGREHKARVVKFVWVKLRRRK